MKEAALAAETELQLVELRRQLSYSEGKRKCLEQKVAEGTFLSAIAASESSDAEVQKMLHECDELRSKLAISEAC